MDTQKVIRPQHRYTLIETHAKETIWNKAGFPPKNCRPNVHIWYANTFAPACVAWNYDIWAIL